MIRLGLAGFGRMGQAIASLLKQTDDLAISAVWARRPDDVDRALLPASVRVADVVTVFDGDVDVVIDFSLPEGTAALCDHLAKHPIPLVCGVSGLNRSQTAAVAAVSERTPVVADRNMSIGVAVMTRLVGEAAGALGPGFEAGVHEVHHTRKVDAPSGTALKLGESIAAARGDRFSDVYAYEGNDMPESARQIRFTVERRGDVPGDHDVSFRSESEVLTLSHSVATRDVFADGAITAARWIVGRPPGLYGMQHVLFADA